MQSLEKERTYHAIEVTHYTNKVEKLTKKQPKSGQKSLPDQTSNSNQEKASDADWEVIEKKEVPLKKLS